MLKVTLKRNKNFIVSKLMKEIDFDFLYSENNDRYLLLNEEVFGEVSREDVIEPQVEQGYLVIIIDENDMTLKAYNYSGEFELDLIEAIEKSYE